VVFGLPVFGLWAWPVVVRCRWWCAGVVRWASRTKSPGILPVESTAAGTAGAVVGGRHRCVPWRWWAEAEGGGREEQRGKFLGKMGEVKTENGLKPKPKTSARAFIQIFWFSFLLFFQPLFKFTTPAQPIFLAAAQSAQRSAY
jgi:hypothetical protein